MEEAKRLFEKKKEDQNSLIKMHSQKKQLEIFNILKKNEEMRRKK